MYQKNLNNRKQYIQINNKEKTNVPLVKCGVPQEPFLELLLFLSYINDLQFISDVLDHIKFPDSTNLFYSHKDINAMFIKLNRDFIKSISGLFLISSHSIYNKNIYFSINRVNRMIFLFYFLN